MTKNLFKILSILLLFGAVSCTQAPDGDKAKVEDAKPVAKTQDKAPAAANAQKGAATYKLDTKDSMVSWVGTKATGRHNGIFKINEGVIKTDGTNITGGEFVIDMKSLKALDQDEEGNKNLAGHLMSDDFFKVGKFPNAKFEITEVRPGGQSKTGKASHTITGNLTMLGVTKSVTFPANVAMEKGVLKAAANFNINRTDWGLSYGSDKSLGDKFIRPEVNIGLRIIGKS